MLSPRGGWLAGGIVSLANAAAYALLFGVFTNSIQTGLGFTYVMTTDQKIGVVVNAILTSVPFGILIGAFAGFYRRFLAMSTPARPAQARSKRR
jgi:ABC-type dipeptide/oligopeptide/nickel transport system permease subunit